MSCQLWFRPFVRYYIYKLNERMNGWNCVIESFDTTISILSFKKWYLSFHPFIRSLANTCSTLKKVEWIIQPYIRSFIRSYVWTRVVRNRNSWNCALPLDYPSTHVRMNEWTDRKVVWSCGDCVFCISCFHFSVSWPLFFNVVWVAWKNCVSVPLNSKH